MNEKKMLLIFFLAMPAAVYADEDGWEMVEPAVYNPHTSKSEAAALLTKAFISQQPASKDKAAGKLLRFQCLSLFVACFLILCL